MFVVLIFRVAQIALSEEIDGTNLQALASKRTTKTDVIPAKRGTIFSSDGEVLAQNVSSYKLIAYLGKEETVTFPTDINGNEYSIYKMGGVKHVIIPEGITSIGDSAFNYCKSLTIYCETASLPSGWGDRWNNSNIPVYWAGQWEYDLNGNTVPLN